MDKLQKKLKENRNRRARERLLSSLDSKFESFLSNVEFSSDISCLKYAAFSTWDMEADCQTTTRGQIPDWKNFTFKTWQDLIAFLKSFKISGNIQGYFFIDIDGPYYLINVHDFMSNIDSLSEYALRKEHFDFGWVGALTDSGIIVEFNQTSFCRNEFEISIWGI